MKMLRATALGSPEPPHSLQVLRHARDFIMCTTSLVATRQPARLRRQLHGCLRPWSRGTTAVLLAACWLCGGHAQALPNPPSINTSQLSPDALALEQSLQRLRAQANGPVANNRAPQRTRGTAGQRDAAWLLGLLALHGIATPVDKAQAEHWFKSAQQLGHPLAPAGLAWCQIDGCMNPPDPTAAQPWIQQLRATDPARAWYLEWWVASRLAPLPTANPTAPGENQNPEPSPHQALLNRAAQAGSAGALNELGLENVAQGRLTTALQQFQAAAPHSSAAATNARLLTNRLREEAGSATPAVAQQRTADQWFAQARRYHRGDGVPANYTEAIRLYQIAANSGSRPAKRMLELIYSRPALDGGFNVAWMAQLANMDVTRDGALLFILPAPTPHLYGRDPTPLYDLVPAQWRAIRGDIVR
jgi:TPR repeat protein